MVPAQARGSVIGLVLAILILVPASSASAAEPITQISRPGGATYWAFLEGPTVVRHRPSVAGKAVARLSGRTYERTTELVVVLAQVENAVGETWYQVRIPSRPNNLLGWLREDRVGEFRATRKHLRIDRARFTATLTSGGAVLFRARVGVGRASWPTPAGEFYLRSRLPNVTGAYGAFAFGTSATSAVLTDWPGGGFIGMHGTDQPGLLPGRVSHGCVRFRNADILRLSKLVGVGTPVTIV